MTIDGIAADDGDDLDVGEDDSLVGLKQRVARTTRQPRPRAHGGLI